MSGKILMPRLDRRALLKGSAALGVAQVASPFVVTARAADTIKIGVDNPLTGTYAATGKNEGIGMALAVDEINAKGGILGRKVELSIEDSTSGDAGVAVQKANKLIDRDQVSFIIGNINSALAQAISNVANEKRIIHLVPGGHTDSITGTNCHWNTFRVCNTTQVEANSVANALITMGKKWYYITPDYAFGHTVQSGLEAAAEKLGGTKVGADLTPLGTTDFSSYLIKAQAANPDVILFLQAGDDAINALKQAVQFGLDKKFHLAGAQQELEALLGLPPEARVGTWVFEWYWNQPNVPGVKEFVAEIRKRSGHLPTARTYFGRAAIHTCALAAQMAGSLDPVKMARALQDFKLPPEIAMMPDGSYYRAGQNQLMANLFVGHAVATGKDDPEDLFVVDKVYKGADLSPSLEDTKCKMDWPA